MKRFIKVNNYLVALDAYMDSPVSSGDKVFLLVVAIITFVSIAIMLLKWI